jgi:molecular chaperone DnaJ
VPTLEGGDVSLRLKPGTQSGSRHRVKGHGVGADGKRGDLIVTVEVAVPDVLSDDERRAVEELARVLRSPRGEETRSK